MSKRKNCSFLKRHAFRIFLVFQIAVVVLLNGCDKPVGTEQIDEGLTKYYVVAGVGEPSVQNGSASDFNYSDLLWQSVEGSFTVVEVYYSNPDAEPIFRPCCLNSTSHYEVSSLFFSYPETGRSLQREVIAWERRGGDLYVTVREQVWDLKGHLRAQAVRNVGLRGVYPLNDAHTLWGYIY